MLGVILFFVYLIIGVFLAFCRIYEDCHKDSNSIDEDVCSETALAITFFWPLFLLKYIVSKLCKFIVGSD